MIKKCEFLIIGSGVAGMSYALKVANSGKGKVVLICKTTLEEANTAKAQGGIASVTNLLVDNFEKHIEDTMIAGDYISDPAAVEQVVRNAPQGIRDLVKCPMMRPPADRFSPDCAVKIFTEVSPLPPLLWLSGSVPPLPKTSG